MDYLHLDFQQEKEGYKKFRNNLHAFLSDKKLSGESPLVYHYESTLGKWLYAHALFTYKYIPEIHELERAHADIYAKAREVAASYKSGRTKTSEKGLQEIEVLGNNIAVLLNTIENKATIEKTENLTDEDENSILAALLKKNEFLKANNTEATGNLLAEQQALHDFFMKSPGIFCILRGPTLIFELINPTAINLIGNRDLIGKPLRKAMPELAAQGFFELLDNVYSSKIPFKGNEIKVYIKGASGDMETLYINLIFQPILNAQDDSTGILVSGYEVTEQVLARNLVIQREEQYKFIIEATQLATWDINPQTNQLYGNERLKEWFGLPPDKEIDIETASKTFSDKDLKRVTEAITKAFDYESGGHYEIEFTINAPGSNPRIVYGKGKAAFDENKKAKRFSGTLQDITEQKSITNKIKELEERARLATEAGEFGTFDINLLTNDVICSKRFHEIYGLDHPAGRNDYISMFYPADLPIRDKAMENAMKTGILNYQVRIIWQDGSVHWIDVDGRISYNDNKKPVRMIGTMKEITGQKKVEEELRRFKFMVDNAIEKFILIKEDGKIAYINEYAWKNWGYTEDEAKELHIKDIDANYNKKQFDKIFQHAKDNITEHYESVYKRKDGSMYDVEINMGGLTIDGKLHLFAVARNVTERKKAETALRISEEKFRLLADSMPQHIWTGDAEGNLNYFNKSVFDFSGLSPEKVYKEGWLQIVHPDEQEENVQAWTEAVKTGSFFLFEHRFRRHDGEYRWQLSRAIPQKDSEGNIQMWVGTSTDINDHKLMTDKLENKVQQRTKELQQLNETLVKSNIELGQFAYVASHDLQEPLRKIQTFATHIQQSESDKLSDRGKDYFNRMQSAAKRMQQLIIDLLSFSRANSDEKYFESVDLNLILDNSKEQLKETILQKKAVVKSAELPVISGIPYQVEQLFNNLISNAVKFSNKDTKPIVEIKYELVDGKYINLNKNIAYHHISFSDNGIGFEPEYAERIFQIFQRLHGREAYPGTGIGLAICKKIVENHNGLLTASSESGKGATFDVYLPTKI